VIQAGGKYDKQTGAGEDEMKNSIRFALIIGYGVLAFGQNPGTFSAAGKMTVSRDAYTATLLANGKVLITGGENPQGQSGVLRSAELYDPRTGAFTRTGDMIFPRSYHSATLLPDGRVLITGGTDRYVGSPLVPTAELYDPDTEAFSDAGDMITAANPAILLASGKGRRKNNFTDSVESCSSIAELLCQG